MSMEISTHLRIAWNLLIICTWTIALGCSVSDEAKTDALRNEGADQLCLDGTRTVP